MKMEKSNAGAIITKKQNLDAGARLIEEENSHKSDGYATTIKEKYPNTNAYLLIKKIRRRCYTNGIRELK